MKVVVNATPIIALSFVNRFAILNHLFNEIIIPKTVFEEITGTGKGKIGAEEVESANWIKVLSPQKPEVIPSFLLGLDEGELEVILLAKEINADLVLIDEKAGRKVVKALGLKVKGTLGILLMAYRKGLINKDEAEKIIIKLENSFIRIAPNLVLWFREQLTIKS